MPLRGRGASYTRTRGAVEWTLANVYRADWPARLVRRLGLQRRVRAVHHRVTSARWPIGAPPMRIAFASDLHAGPTTHESIYDEAFALLAEADADVILLGGDYVFLNADRIDVIASRLAKLHPRLGSYAVMGNHDLWADDAAIAAALSAAGARVLLNERVELAPHVTLVGVDDPWTGVPPALPLFRTDDAFRLVLAHAPELLLRVGDDPFELALCGHTHGGHIALPGEIPLLVPSPLSRKYAHGRRDAGHGRTLIVSRGVGSTEVTLRTYADPDILVVDIGQA